MQLPGQPIKRVDGVRLLTESPLNDRLSHGDTVIDKRKTMNQSTGPQQAGRRVIANHFQTACNILESRLVEMIGQ